MRYILMLAILLLANQAVEAQEDDRIFRRYLTQEYMKQLKEDSKLTSEKLRDIEAFLLRNQSQVSIKEVSLPIVFHILYSNKKDRLSQGHIQQQLDVVNAIFRTDRINKNSIYNVHWKRFADQTFDTKISFCAQTGNGSGNLAINYVETDVEQWELGNDMKSSETGGVDPWDTKKYINVWVVDMAEQEAGFAQLPGGPDQTDGIVINTNFFGINNNANPDYYKGGKTLVHLLGGYLGLHELWNQYELCVDDGVFDTPIHNGPNFEGVTELSRRHISLCPGWPTEMSINMMDNTDDDHLYMFTKGQVQRMHTTLFEGGPRYSLVQQTSVCNLPKLKIDVPSNHSDLKVNDIEIYPNPVKDQTQLRISTKSALKAEIQITNSLGQVLLLQNIVLDKTNLQIPINTTNWSGVCFVQVKFDEDQIIKKKFTVIN